MSSSRRRFEILLPRWFNDRTQVPDELFGDCVLKLRQRFGSVSSETQPIRGFWEHQWQVHIDELFRFYVDVPDTVETRQFF